MEIKQMLAPVIYDGARSGIKRTRNGGVTVHNTGNYSKGAGALNHGTYLQSGGAHTQTSWHYAVDDTNIVQSIPSDEVAWHAGDGQGNGNMTTEAIEICVNPDSDIRKATDNAAWLAAQRLKAQGHGTDHLYQHHDWSGKNCPEEIRKGNPYDWATFKAKVAGYLGESTTKPNPAPQPSTGSCKYDVGTPVCTNHIWSSSTDIGAGFSGDWSATITRVVVGARHPYLIGDGIGWTDDASIDSDPHAPGQTASKPASKPSANTGTCKYGVGTPVCTNVLATSSTGGKVYKGDWRGTITKVIPGSPYPYLLNDGTGWTNDQGIDSDPHSPV